MDDCECTVDWSHGAAYCHECLVFGVICVISSKFQEIEKVCGAVEYIVLSSAWSLCPLEPCLCLIKALTWCNTILLDFDLDIYICQYPICWYLWGEPYSWATSTPEGSAGFYRRRLLKRWRTTHQPNQRKPTHLLSHHRTEHDHFQTHFCGCTERNLVTGKRNIRKCTNTSQRTYSAALKVITINIKSHVCN